MNAFSSTVGGVLAVSVLMAGPAAAQTHMGQSWKEHVNVQFFAGGGRADVCPVGGRDIATLAMYRILPDGATQPFVVPAGKLLVVTDFNVTAANGGTGTVKQSLHLSLSVIGPGKTSGPIVYRSSFHLAADLVSSLYSLTGQSLSGLVVSEGVSICPSVRIEDGSTQGIGLSITAGNYRGYLIAE
jgi:hypothetical protein